MKHDAGQAILRRVVQKACDGDPGDVCEYRHRDRAEHEYEAQPPFFRLQKHRDCDRDGEKSHHHSQAAARFDNTNFDVIQQD